MKLDIKQKAVSNLPLKPIQDKEGGFKNGGFVRSVLKEVVFDTQTYEKGEYEGKEVPVLKFVWENYRTSDSEPVRVHIHTEKILPTLQRSGENMEPIDEDNINDNIQNMWKRIKHIIEELYTSPNYRSVDTITEKQYNENFDIPATGTVEDRVTAYTKFFKFIAEFVNGKGNQKSMLADHKYAKDGGLPQNLKLIASYPERKGYVIPRWTRSGFVEAMLFDNNGKPMAPVRLEFAPSETIVLAKTGTYEAKVDNSSPSSEAKRVADNLGLDLDD